MKTRKGAALADRPSPNLTDAASLTDAHLLDEAYRRGYRLSCRCIRCGKWLTAEPVHPTHIGPKCRRRLDAQAVAA